MQSPKSFSPITDAPSSRHSSSSSPLPSLPSTRAQRSGSRTTNACEACKKRKTKCSGPPGPCETCQRVETFCHFNTRLDTRRKLAYKLPAVQERQQHILHGLLLTLKFGEEDEMLKLISLIRTEALPQDIAACLRKSIQSLQDRGILQFLAVDETDITSLALQGLFSHRAGKLALKRSPKELTSSIKNSLVSQEFCSRPEAPSGKYFSTPPHLRFQEHAGNNGHASYRILEPVSQDNNTTGAFSADIQAPINANEYTSRQLIDLERMEYELSSRHGISNWEWNIPNWTYEENPIRDGY